MKKKTKYIVLTFLAVLSAVIIAGMAYFILSIDRDSDGILTTGNETPNTIKLYVDEDPHDSSNLKEVHIANVYVVDGEVYKEILDELRTVEIAMLDKAFAEIKSLESLPLMVEPELGLLQTMNVSRDNENYVYAVAEYLGSAGFNTDVDFGYIGRGILSGANCSEEYDQIDSDMQNANYCTVDEDCKTLPLAGPYIEFGCYHYINKNENSSEFYGRMNEYSAECGNIIDLCSPTPEAKCAGGKCVEGDSE